MAVYTDVADEDLAAFLDTYDIGEALAFKGIAEGVENSNFLLHTQSGFFILTLYEKRVNAADLPFFLGLLEHLSAQGVTCPQPVKNRRGEALGTLSGKPAAIVTFLDGVSIRRPEARHCGMLGEALAKLGVHVQTRPRRPRDTRIGIPGARAPDAAKALLGSRNFGLQHGFDRCPSR